MDGHGTSYGKSIRGGGDLSKKLTSLSGDKVEITYSELSHRTTAYVSDINGDKKLVKQEDMPKEFKDIHDPVTFLAFLDDVSVRTATLSNGDIKLDVMHGLKGGMPPKLDLSVKSSGTPFGADSLGKTQYTHAQAPTLSVGGGVMAEYVPGGLVTKTSIGPRFDDPNNSFAVTVEHATFNGKKAGATSYVFSGRINL